VCSGLNECLANITATLAPGLAGTLTPSVLAAAVGVPVTSLVTFQLKLAPMVVAPGPDAGGLVTILTATVGPAPGRAGLSSEQLLGNLLLANHSGLLLPVVERLAGASGLRGGAFVCCCC
jgi:hypothetical protein